MRHLLQPLCLILGLLGPLALSGCFGDQTGDDDDAGDDDAEDDDAEDDDAGDDDAGDDDSGDDDSGDDDSGDDDSAPVDPDDNTCDEGASASTSIHFVVTNTFYSALDGATWAVHDLDAASGTLAISPTVSGTTAADGFIDVQLDCADGWMMLEVAHADTVTLHNYFRVMPVPHFPIIAPTNQIANPTIGLLISSDDEGVLGVYKPSSVGSPDCQGVDTFTIDGGPDLVPAGAANDIGLWVYDGALGNELADIWNVSADVPDQLAVGALLYFDDSDEQYTAVNATIWSWDASPSPDGAHHVTTVYVMD